MSRSSLLAALVASAATGMLVFGCGAERECSYYNDCGPEAYCGADYQCVPLDVDWGGGLGARAVEPDQGGGPGAFQMASDATSFLVHSLEGTIGQADLGAANREVGASHWEPEDFVSLFFVDSSAPAMVFVDLPAFSSLAGAGPLPLSGRGQGAAVVGCGATGGGDTIDYDEPAVAGTVEVREDEEGVVTVDFLGEFEFQGGRSPVSGSASFTLAE